jgi:hypothetical protein
VTAGVVEDRVGTINAYVVLTDHQAEQLLRGYLRNLGPELAGVNEWDGPKPDLTALGRREADVDELLSRVIAGNGTTHYRFRRPRGGGNPVVWNATRYRLITIDRVELVGAEFVGHLPGRKSKLPASTATLAVFEDLVLGGEVVLIVIHLTAEVQVGDHYRTDLTHALRVRRHKRERQAVERLVRHFERTGALVRVAGDTNFDGMPLPPLTSCWVGHKRAEAAGTLGHRTVDYVYSRGHSADVQTQPTRSDHDAVVAVYRRKEKP